MAKTFKGCAFSTAYNENNVIETLYARQSNQTMQPTAGRRAASLYFRGKDWGRCSLFALSETSTLAPVPHSGFHGRTHFAEAAAVRDGPGLSWIIEIRAFRGGWQCWEGDGVGPYWVGETAQEDALSYATTRASSGRSQIRVLDNNANVIKTLDFDPQKR